MTGQTADNHALMTALDCALTGKPPELPDAGHGACCIGAAVHGPQRCTCWVPVYDLDQQPVRPGLPLPRVPLRMCGDCAYRPHSPERQGAEDYAGDEDLLEELVASGTPFYCHEGIRHPIAWRHPSGVEVPGHPGSYDPPILAGVPYKADGTPANVCTGWLLRRAKVTGVADAGESGPSGPAPESDQLTREES